MAERKWKANEIRAALLMQLLLQRTIALQSLDFEIIVFSLNLIVGLYRKYIVLIVKNEMKSIFRLFVHPIHKKILIDIMQKKNSIMNWIKWYADFSTNVNL